MNLQDRLAELLLTALDGLIDLITLGVWSRWQGSTVPRLKVKE